MICKQKILFLDVDGVLNNIGDLLKYDPPFGPDKLRLLKKIVDETGCIVVVSSSWQISDVLLDTLRKALDKVGVSIFDVTGDDFFDRSRNIEGWLERRVGDEEAVVVVLDDSPKASIQGRSKWKTRNHIIDSGLGLGDSDASVIINHFNCC